MTLRHAISAFAIVWLALAGALASAKEWKSYPEDLYKPDVSGDNLEKEWSMLTRATRDAFPKDPELQEVWRLHHQGEFAAAKAKGLALGSPQALYVAYRAQTIYALYMTPHPSGDGIEYAERTVLLKDAADNLQKLVDAMDAGKIPYDDQIRFWFAYTMGRYVELMKPTWGILTKKAKMKEMLKYANKIPPQTHIPAFHAFRGGVYAAIYEEGYLARVTFRNYIEDCDGNVVGYEEGTLSQFRCAEKHLHDAPFPTLYTSYSKALHQIDAVKYQEEIERYRQYGAGAQVPRKVDTMIYNVEDSLARADIIRQRAMAPRG